MKPTSGIVKELEAKLQAYKDACDGMQSSTLKLWVQDIREDFAKLNPYAIPVRSCNIADGVVANIKQLRAENERLQKQLQDAHQAMEPYIAGGSEYTGASGLIRAIHEVGERMRQSQEAHKRIVIQRNDAESQLKEARAACDLYENELIKLRDKYDSAKHALWISSGYEKMMLDGSDETTAPVQPLGNLNIYDDDDTQEVEVEPVSSQWMNVNDMNMTWQRFLISLDNEDES